jgi:hypothetical protein
MLDLTALEARFRNLSLFGCKAAGGKVPLFYRDGWRDGKKHWVGGDCGKNRRYRYRGKLLIVDF